TGGDELSGASGSSTTISLSGVAIGPVVDGGAALVTLPGQGGRKRRRSRGRYFATKPASVIRLLFSVSSSSRNFSMSGPVRKIGFNACFSRYSLYSAVCETFLNRST